MTRCAMLAVLLAGAAPPGQEEKVPLRLEFRKGQVLKYRTDQTVVIGPSTHRLRDTFRMTVADVAADGTASLSVVFQTVAARATGFQEYAYDSEKDGTEPESPDARTFAALVGQEFTMKVSPRGRVSEVLGFKRIQEKLLMTAGGEQEMPLVRQVIGQMLSDRIMTTRLQQIWMVLPPEPTAPGESWKEDLPIHLPYLGGVYLMTTSTLKETADGAATVTHTARPKPMDELLGGLVQYKKTKGTGTAVFALERKVIRSSTLDLSLTVTTGNKSLDLKLTFVGKLVE